MTQVIREVVEALPSIDLAEAKTFFNGIRNTESHSQALNHFRAFQSVEVGGAAKVDSLPSTFRVMAWNMERCMFPLESAKLLQRFNPDVLLVSEMDVGMARTQQRHNARIMAEYLSMSYCYGLEFFELGLGGPTEQTFCNDSFNEKGFHGNAILSRVPLINPVLFRVSDESYWFNRDSAEEPRIGTRHALAATLATAAGEVVVVSAHLENATTPDKRCQQLLGITQMASEYAEGRPIVVGGDMNSFGQALDLDWQGEPLFAAMEAEGFEYKNCNLKGPTVRESLINRKDWQLKLDWFFIRQLESSYPMIVPALDEWQRPLSDHDIISLDITP